MDIEKLMMNDKFKDTTEQVLRQLSQYMGDYYDDNIDRQDSLLLTYFHQLANFNVTPSIDDTKKISKEPSLKSSTESLTASLDPTDWKSARAEAHKMLDISLDFIEKARDRPAWIPK